VPLFAVRYYLAGREGVQPFPKTFHWNLVSCTASVLQINVEHRNPDEIAWGWYIYSKTHMTKR
jgi:hypothetical protein